ncbi:Predicted dienelactone hydrolase [Algoriella xinjiangensis]|uniref:alpha/beta hydrolase family protein n=1 Tax=Algoriella xinjiangensis TaxID=684065 RepID=UPI000FBE2A80|nr:YqiA/YcfP family alpha/beta fold hydrolase [Algoriella xinjiangensis]VDH17447.1 Predicted dienelactone hydrolase [Algoriella xinjiangensis]
MDGYFVFLPNLEYQIGNLGESIVVNIENSVEELASRSYIDKNRLGLIGHSFGGYEATFIATHSNFFKAIVAGSGVMDLVSWSHDVQWEGWFREQAWRLESQQFRMKHSYYTDKNNYLRNSPFYHVENMKTPLLLWAGKSDYNINWYQSIYMYMAMKKLNKEGKLILFNNDGHYLTRKENQEMLYDSILNWFNTYLK